MSSYPVNRFGGGNYQVSSAVGGDATDAAAGDITRPATESPNMRANAINNVCKGTLCPDQYMTSPVAKNYPQVTKVQMKESTTIKVTAPYAGNPNNQASADPSTGVIVVNWKEGPSTGVYHMGILPAGAVWVNTDSYDPGLKNAMTYSGGPTTYAGVTQLTLNKALALPYNKGSLKQIRITSTNLAQNFTRSRYYSARMTMISDTVQLNAGIAAGNVTASVITESQGVAQNVAGDDCYSVSDIVNGSRWKPETVQAHSLMDGVTILQGPDIVEIMPPVDQVNRNRTDGAWQSLAAQIGWNTQRSSAGTLAWSATSGVITPIWGTWISPCNVLGNLATGNSYIFTNNYSPAYFDPIPEMQMVSVRIHAPWTVSATTVSTSSYYRAWVVVEHYFGSLNANGQLVISTIATTHSCGEGSIMSLMLGPGGNTNFRLSDNSVGIIDVESDPRSEYVRRRNNGNDPGKYFGTQCSMYFSAYNQIVTETPLTFRIGGQDNAQFDTVADGVFEVCAVSLNTDQSGPFTIIRYDEVAVGQNIRINSLVNTENVSKSALSVIAPTDVYDVCYDINIYALLDSLFFGPHTDFRCVWTNSNYRKLLAKLSNWQLSDLIKTVTASPQSMQIAEAAGMFDNLKSWGRGLLGMTRSAMQNPMIRQLARHTTDGLVARIPHSGARQIAGSLVDAGLNHFANDNEVISQDGATNASSRGYFGDSGWI